MRYVMMKPDEIREAVRRNVPVLLAAGAVEYHGPHLPIGTDVLIAESLIERVAGRCECIVLPPLPFAPTMLWAAGPADGEFDFDPDALAGYAEELFRGLLAVGFRRIYVVQHHQGREGLPALTLRRAAAKVTRALTLDWGAEWGRERAPLPEPAIFSLIRVAQIDEFAAYASPEAERIPIGHAGKGETQLIWAAYPDAVEMDKFHALAASEPLPSWLLDTAEASREEGERWLDFCAEGWVKELTRA
ncbi:creatininase family protein [Paenibacillus lycopersici]|uniref:Creatininase family protein n=1 Tax=Paenibacillus lycopersici TaxID=2704462 RepID=A0A6C0FZF3_9BACL|nr:creatininase family protein [Paenibacillus lycopersici]QHT59600.1 creatininase family protein [Paenibacillus lycopersici]